MKTMVYQSVYDPCRFVMEPGDVLRDHHFKCGPSYGHILFKHDPCVIVQNGSVLIENNIFENWQ